MSADVAELMASAKAAAERAYAPYSGFPVGAAVLAEDGQVYAGCNVENASYPQGWCAEASALSAMVMGGARRLQAVAVFSPQAPLCTPCGGCRQKLREFADETLPIHLTRADGGIASYTLGELLPHAFGPEHLPE